MPEQLGLSPDERRIIVFDVNETLLDIEVLAPLFERVFGDRRVMREWFAQLILYSEAITLAGSYQPFSQLGAGVLQMVAAVKGVEVHEPDLDELRSLMQAIPAHPEVLAALASLQKAGFRLVTLTNSAPQPGGGPLEHAGDRYVFRAAIQRRPGWALQAGPRTIPHGRQGSEGRDQPVVDGGLSRLGSDRGATGRMLGSVRAETWQCPAASFFPTPSRCGRP